jgi:hypothetical protein
VAAPVFLFFRAATVRERKPPQGATNVATDAQISANQQNSQHSTGPKTESGKTASCQNNFKYGLTGASFTVLDSEDQDEYDHVLCGLRFEHQPSTMTESILVEKMAQSYWLRKRALYLQDQCATDEDSTLEEQQKQLALFIRYQTTHDRAFHTALNSLLKLRAEKRKAEFGFESQKRREATESRREAAEKRKQELHQFAVLLAEAKVDHQFVLTSNAKLDGIIAATRENIPLEAQKAA